MKNKTEPPKTTAIVSTPQPLSSLDNDPEIQQTRKILSIIIYLMIGFAIAYGCDLIVAFVKENHQERIIIVEKLIPTIIEIFLYGFGLISIYRYFVIGLRIFGWLIIISFVALSISFVIVLGMFIIHMISIGSVNNEVNREKKRNELTKLTSLIDPIFPLVLLPIIAKYTFKLIKLIEERNTLLIKPVV